MKGPNIILAGPGTGKTTFIVEAITNILETSQQKHEGIIVCTFTRKATAELKVRLHQKCSVKKLNAGNFIIGTIHSICYELLARYSTRGYGNYQILPEDSQINYIYSKLKNLGFPAQDVKKSGWRIAEDLAVIFNKITDEEIDVSQINFGKNEYIEDACMVYRTYKKILQKDNLFDFATIQATLIKELNECPDFLMRVQDDFKYLLVDEYQDVNNIQNQIFLKLSGPLYNLTIVGDDDQSIYGFRGANVGHIKTIGHHIQGMGVPVSAKILSINYRSTGGIVDFTNEIIELSEEERIEKKIRPKRATDSHKPIYQFFSAEDEEVNFITQTIRSLVKQKFIKNFSDVAILFRSLKSQGGAVIRGLNQNGIPYILTGAGDFFNMPLGLEIMALWDFYLARDDEKEEVFFDKMAQADVGHGTDLTSFYSAGNLLELLNARFDTRKYASCIDLLYDIMIETQFIRRYYNYGENIGQLTSMVLSFDDFSDFFNPWGLFSYISYLKREQKADFTTKDTGNAVKLMTIHQAKGLEFPVVFLPSQIERRKSVSIIDQFNNLVYPNSKRSSEELRVLYVGATRAEELLILSGSHTLNHTKKSYSQNRYLEEAAAGKVLTSSLNPDLLANQVRRNAQGNPQKNVILSYNKVRLYEMCPVAYMFANEWNLETIRVGGLEFGSNVHKILEVIIRKIQDGQLLQEIDLDVVIDNNWNNSNFRSENENLKFKSAATRQISGFIKNNGGYLKKENIFSVEDEFNVVVDNYLINGRFDVVFQKDHKKIIVDFKTGDRKDYSSQLSFYSVCFGEKYNEKNPDLAVYYLKEGTFESIQPVDAAVVSEKIRRIAQNIENGCFPATPGKICKDCAFKSICDYR